MTNTPRPNRTAFTLIEILITITMGSSIMLTSVALLHKSFQLHALAQDRVQREQLLDRFVHQFRSDAYAATDAKIFPASRLALSFVDGNQVVYTTQDNLLSRELPGQGMPRETVTLRQESVAGFEVTDDGQRVILVVKQDPGLGVDNVRRRIEVAIGRFAAAESFPVRILAEEPS